MAIKFFNRNTIMLCDAVFEGGGMRGIGLVGAALAFETKGYRFRNVAGSSAGAIVASLIAAGFSATEMYEIMSDVKFEQFKHSRYGFGNTGLAISAIKNFGIYSAKQFEEWLAELLARKNVHKFADLREGSLKVTASDVTDEKTLVLPDDLEKFGIDPKSFSVATAVRMSMSIPIFYEPYELVDSEGNVHYIVDGGMLSNYPIWILDDGNAATDIPIFGFRFLHKQGHVKSKRTSIMTYIKQIISTLASGGEEEYHVVVRGDMQRTVYIDTKVDGIPISITDFGINANQIESLFRNGNTAATQFLETWNYKDWKRKYRR